MDDLWQRDSQGYPGLCTLYWNEILRYSCTTWFYCEILWCATPNTGEWMVLVQFHYDEEGDDERAKALMQHIADRFPQITSLFYVDNQKGNDTFNDLELTLFKGNDHIFETMEDLRFKVGPKSFYQTNTEQAYHLYSVAREFANLTGNELVYDLYTGTGTIANFVAKKAQKVIGIEYVPEAIEDAKVNSEVNKIDNTLFYAGDDERHSDRRLHPRAWTPRRHHH